MKHLMIVAVAALLALAGCGATAENLHVGSNRVTVEITRTVKVTGVKAQNGLEAVIEAASKVEGGRDGN